MECTVHDRHLENRTLIKQIAPLIEQQYAHLEQGFGSDTVAKLYLALDEFLAAQDKQIALVELPELRKTPTTKKTDAAAGPATARKKVRAG